MVCILLNIALCVHAKLFHSQNHTVAGPAANSRRKSIDRRSSPDENKATQLVKEVPPQRRQSQSRKLPIDPSKVHNLYNWLVCI